MITKDQKKLLHLLQDSLPAGIPDLRKEQVVFNVPAPDRVFTGEIKPPAFIKKYAKLRHIMPEFCYVLKGEMALAWGDSVYRLEAGDYCFIPRMIRHFESHTDPAVPYENLWLRFGSDMPLSVLHGESDHYNYRIINRVIIPFDNQCLDILPGLETDDQLPLEKVKKELARLYAALDKTIRKKDYLFVKRFEKEKSFKRRALVQVRNYVMGHLTEKLTLNELASQLSVTPRYLSGLFKNEYGVSVVRYINSQRMDQALALLEDPGLNISEIAEKLKFRDIYYFSRLFKKHFGISPKDFRNKYL